jgi:hypothetical protein
MTRHTETRGRGSEGATGELGGYPACFARPRSIACPAQYKWYQLTRRRRLNCRPRQVIWTPPPFAQKRNLVSACVPSNPNCTIQSTACECKRRRHVQCRSQWPRCLRRWSAAKRLLGSWVRIPPRSCHEFFFLLWVFVLSGRGLCNGLIPRPEESYRLWCVSECDQVEINNLDTYCEQVGRRGKD